MQNHSRITGPVRHLDRIDGFGQRANLVQFDENGVTDALGNALLKNTGIASVIRRLIHRGSEGRLRITYADGRGLLRTILVKASEMGFETMVTASRQVTHRDWKGAVVDMRVSGKKDVSDLLSVLSMVDGVVEVEVLDDEH